MAHNPNRRYSRAWYAWNARHCFEVARSCRHYTPLWQSAMNAAHAHLQNALHAQGGSSWNAR